MSQSSNSFVRPRRGRKNRTLIAAAVVVIILLVVSVAAFTILTTPSKKSVVFDNYWATTGKVGLKYLIPAFEKAYPQYKVVSELTPGAGGITSKAKLISLIESGKAPASFQVHFGPEMLSYAEVAPHGAKTFVNMTPIIQQSGVLNHSVPAVFQAGAFNGTLLSMPVNVHRDTLLFINSKLLKQYNLPVPTNMSLLTSDTNALVKDGLQPWGIAGGDGGWDQSNLWQSIFLAYAGPTLYKQAMYGVLNTANSTVSGIVNRTDAMFLNYSATDYSGWQTLSWTNFLSLMIKNKVAFLANGNWVTNYAYDFLNTTVYPAQAPYLSQSNATVLEEPFPGTQNYYSLVVDSIAVPHSTSQAGGVALAKFWSSWQGQTTWTKWKAVTYYNNVTTNYFNTPSQWADYKQLVSTPESNFIYSLTGGGFYDNAFGTTIGDLLALQNAGKSGIATWNSQFSSVISTQHSDWKTAAGMGLGYMGFPGHPFANYYPPWVNASALVKPAGKQIQGQAHQTVSVWNPGLLVLSEPIASDAGTSHELL